MRKAQNNLEFNVQQIKQLPSERLVALVVQQQQVIAELQQEVERLKLSLQKDSKTSSKPPSTDLLFKPEKPRTDSEKIEAPKRKPGGQPGHQGKTRKGFGRVDRYEQLLPQECLQCGSVEFVQVPVAVECKQVAQLVARPILVVDESPWPVLGLKEWLWVTTGQQFCVFHAGDTRSRAELIAQLGESFDGVLNTDDYSVYNGYSVKAQQKCLAHLRRHFKKVVKLKSGNNQALGQAFLDLIDEAFAQHRRADLSATGKVSDGVFSSRLDGSNLLGAISVIVA